MDKEINLWEEIGNKCLWTALSVLKKETVPTAATVETVMGLVETAISIDRKILSENRSDLKVSKGLLSLPREAES